jgi:drug/metabolite transporter (DMT)-like permease
VNNSIVKWGLFIILCIIWGSSFELMKLGMYENHDFSRPLLSPYQVAAIRMLSAGIIMLPFVFTAYKRISKQVFLYAMLSGLLGSFFPAFLFCIAETQIGGAVAGSLNSLTPIFVIITGALFFEIKTNSQKIIGVIIGLIGSAILLYANTKSNELKHLWYCLVVILATIFYGINVNMVTKRLKQVTSIDIASIAFVSLIIPSVAVLIYTGFFKLDILHNTGFRNATLASTVLGMLGTAIASILFYMLVKRATGLFASMVTYGIPFVAIGWGLINNEALNIFHFIGLIIILLGVFIANKQH